MFGETKGDADDDELDSVVAVAVAVAMEVQEELHAETDAAVEGRASERDDAGDVIATSSKGTVDTDASEISSLSGGSGGGGVKLLTVVDKLTVVLPVKEVTLPAEGEEDEAAPVAPQG